MDARVTLFWLPLGAGGHSVRWNGRVYEALVARIERRARCDLYHAALELEAGDGARYVIEMAPAWSGPGEDRGVAVQGPVGSRLLGRSRLFRYEVRCWRDGTIPDLAEAVGGPVAVTTSSDHVAGLLRRVPAVPALVWGRDESGTDDMWNSNSVVAWLLSSSGHDTAALTPPAGGRAPGWRAGLALAQRASPAP